MSNIHFNGKVVLITGSSSGIGEGTAILFAKSGANVVITGRNATKLTEVAKKCQQISPNNSIPLQVIADVTKEEDLKRLVETTVHKFGKIDILVNNAGYVESKHITDTDYMKAYKSILQTNLNSAVFLTHLCSEHLAKTKGNIVNVSSISAYLPANKISAYCMSKSGMDIFTKCMAGELGSLGIRVNSVNPGSVKTHILDKTDLDKDKLEQYYVNVAKNYPVGRVGLPEDIGNAILFLASDRASFITGTIMIADGGHMAANVSRIIFDF